MNAVAAQETKKSSFSPGMDCAAYLLLDNSPIETESRILMVLEVDKEKPDLMPKWKLPGGKSIRGERDIQTMHRETLEEIGITCENPSELESRLITEETEHNFVVFSAYMPQITAEHLRLGSEILNASFFTEPILKNLIAQGLVVGKHAAAVKKYWKNNCFFGID